MRTLMVGVSAVEVMLALVHLSCLTACVKATLSGLEDSPLTEVRAVEGDRVLLPCDFDSAKVNDSTHLVLFYRGDVGTPIYSLDSRGVSLEHATQWSSKAVRGRAYMMLGKSQSGLLLQKVQLKDAGEYRCRVDFLESPTRNLRIRLLVVAPPHKLTITSDYQPEAKVTGTVGPFPAGAEVTLSCQVLGGYPRPQVTWWQEGSLLDDVSEVKTSHVTRNALFLPPLTRSDLNKTLTCQAANSDLVMPLSKTVIIDLIYPPTWVQLISGSEGQLLLVEGLARQLTCEAEAARPPARLQWWKDGELITDNIQAIVEDGVSRSRLTLTATSSDDGSQLTCRAFSPALPNHLLHDSTRLTVFYKPKLELYLGPGLDVDDVEEGEEVTFKCLVDANPPVTGVQWAQNGVPLRASLTKGVLVSQTSLVLQSVTRDSSGDYTCAAANTEGVRTSNTIHLAVKFPPTCTATQHTVYGAARHEQLHVPCQVLAHPVPVAFRWAMNTSTGVVDVPLNLSSSSGFTSVVRYTPKTHRDFGHLLCWALNDIGLQQQPCVFRIIPAAKPESVSQCQADRNATMPATYVVLSCLPGWDGGLNQTFTLEVRQAAKEEVLEAFRHASEPHFIITGLKVGVQYQLTVTAANLRGSSSPLTIAFTPTAASAHRVVSPHAHTTLLSVTPFLVLLIGVLMAMSVCGAMGVVLAKRRKRQKSGAKILCAGPLKDISEKDIHAIVCINRDHEKGEMLKSSAVGVASSSFCVNQATFLNSSGGMPMETDVLLRENGVPLACVEPMARCSTPSSACTTFRSSQASCSTGGLFPDYLDGGPVDILAQSSSVPLLYFRKESSV